MIQIDIQDLRRAAKRIWIDESLFNKLKAELLLREHDIYIEISKWLVNNRKFSDCLNNNGEYSSSRKSTQHSTNASPNRFGIIDFVLSLVNRHRKGKSPSASSELYCLLKNVPHDVAVRALMNSLGKLSPAQQKEILDQIYNNDSNINSSVHIELKKRELANKDFRDSYNYCLYVHNIKSDERRPLRFKNHASTAIYVLYLIDRCKNGFNAKSLDVVKNKETFKEVYQLVFNDWKTDPLHGLGDTITKDDNGNYKTAKNRLSDYYNDINATVKSCLSDWDFIYPYRFDKDSCLSLKPENIEIPQEVLNGNWNIQI